jgi:hypothetical protein
MSTPTAIAAPNGNSSTSRTSSADCVSVTVVRSVFWLRVGAALAGQITRRNGGAPPR